MTAAQSKFLFREWAAAAKAHGWQTVAGVADAILRYFHGAVWSSPEMNATLGEIYQAAGCFARGAGGAAATIKPDHIRRAVTLLAVGRPASWKTLTNRDLDQLLPVLRVLAAPENLQNLLALQNAGEVGARRRYLHAIQTAPSSYWQRIAADKFGTIDLARLTVAQLEQLALTLRLRHPVHAPRTTHHDTEH